MKKKIFIIGLVLISSLSYSQWSKGKGKGYFKLSAWYLETDQHFTDTGAIDPNATRTNFNVNLYAEYGLINKLDVVGYIPFFARATQNNVLSQTTGETIQEGEALNSIGDIDLGLNYNFLKTNNWSASAKLIFGLPTGEDSGGSDGSYQTGDGEFNQIAYGLLGYSSRINESLPFYAKTYLGFNNRTQGFSDEFRYGLEAGINIYRNKFWLIGRLDGVESFQNGSLDATNAPQGSIFANNVEYLSLGGELNYYLTEKIGVSVGFASAVSGRIIAANPSVTGGVFLDIK